MCSCAGESGALSVVVVADTGKASESCSVCMERSAQVIISDPSVVFSNDFGVIAR